MKCRETYSPRAKELLKQFYPCIDAEELKKGRCPKCGWTGFGHWTKREGYYTFVWVVPTPEMPLLKAAQELEYLIARTADAVAQKFPSPYTFKQRMITVSKTKKVFKCVHGRLHLVGTITREYIVPALIKTLARPEIKPRYIVTDFSPGWTYHRPLTRLKRRRFQYVKFPELVSRSQASKREACEEV